MLSLAQISDQYPEHLQAFKRNMLREYLQYKILEALFDIQDAAKLFFIGGTALRLIHGSERFSEDLDFDTQGIDQEQFEKFSKSIKKQLEREGFLIEIKNVFKGAYHCHIRFPELLYTSGLSSFKEEKILIQIDAESQGFQYQPEWTLINKFDVFTRIPVAPVDVLLSQKICAALYRKRAKGRDFYDITFLYARTSPNFEQLSVKAHIENPGQLKKALQTRCKELNFEALAQDVAPFLFFEKDRKRIRFFPEFVNTLSE